MIADTFGGGRSVPASQSTVISGGQLIHSGSELAAAGVTSPGVAGAPATGPKEEFNASDVFSRIMEAAQPQASPSVDVTQVGVSQPASATALPRVSRSFTLTPHQRNVLGGFFGDDETTMRDYLMKAIGSNDASLGPYTPEQLKAYRMQASTRKVRGATAEVSMFKSIIGKALESYKVS